MNGMLMNGDILTDLLFIKGSHVISMEKLRSNKKKNKE